MGITSGRPVPVIAYGLCIFRSISDFGGHLLVLPWFWYTPNVICSIVVILMILGLF